MAFVRTPAEGIVEHYLGKKVGKATTHYDGILMKITPDLSEIVKIALNPLVLKVLS